jgi:hypothetical protein
MDFQKKKQFLTSLAKRRTQYMSIMYNLMLSLPVFLVASILLLSASFFQTPREAKMSVY